MTKPKAGDTVDVVVAYVDSLGLSQYSDAITSAKIDGAVFAGMTLADWKRAVGMTERDAATLLVTEDVDNKRIEVKCSDGIFDTTVRTARELPLWAIRLASDYVDNPLKTGEPIYVDFTMRVVRPILEWAQAGGLQAYIHVGVGDPASATVRHAARFLGLRDTPVVHAATERAVPVRDAVGGVLTMATCVMCKQPFDVNHNASDSCRCHSITVQFEAMHGQVHLTCRHCGISTVDGRAQWAASYCWTGPHIMEHEMPEEETTANAEDGGGAGGAKRNRTQDDVRLSNTAGLCKVHDTLVRRITRASAGREVQP